jgi:hypothetical protein
MNKQYREELAALRKMERELKSGMVKQKRDAEQEITAIVRERAKFVRGTERELARIQRRRAILLGRIG